MGSEVRNTMKTIAVIDDDIHIGDMLEEVLRREGFRVLRAYSGTEALYLLSQNRPDLILLDLMLPGLSGEEVLPKIQGIPVIVASALTPLDAERLFDRFYTVETGRNSTGLGLSIARLLTERMGGVIRADYSKGRLYISLAFPETNPKPN